MQQTKAFKLPETERKIVLIFFFAGFAHLAVGILMGILQALQHSGIDLYSFLPMIQHYYQGLSIHGIFNVFIFPTCFIGGFLTFVTSRGFKRPMQSQKLNWALVITMVLGMLLIDFTLLLNQASVMWTSYAPLKASPFYYLGMVLVVVGTWILLVNIALTYVAWKRDNPGKRTPLIAFGALATVTMWALGSFGIAAEFLFMLIPWSAGWIEGTDPLLTRTLFWMSGHPIVYFLVLPAYISWYFMLPKEVGGRLFSEPLARLSFLLFIPLSLPVGFHHQFLDPGISPGHKGVHTFLTLAVFMPSMITAFTVLASLEIGARVRGGKGWLAWIRRLPWGNPSVTGQVLAMVLYALGGISGLVNGSYTLNLIVHNTMFVPGHFHLTVGSASALTFMAIAYWLVPYLSGKKLWSRKLGLWQTWLWAIGMAVMSRGMSWSGLLGAPRRTMLGSAPYALPEWDAPFVLAAIGGTIVTISGIFFFANLIMTVWRGKKGYNSDVPLAQPLEEERNMPAMLDRFVPWVVVSLILVALAYAPPIIKLLQNLRLDFAGLAPY